MNVNPDYNVWGQMIKEFEGFKQQAYLCPSKVWTIGFGSTYNYTAKRKVKAGDYVTLEEAIRWMRIEFQEVVRLANTYIKKPLTLAQSTAVCDYIYNRGIGNFLKTQLDDLINVNPNDPRIYQEIRGTGLTDKLGNILRGLKRRRNCQANLYFTGQIKFS